VQQTHTHTHTYIDRVLHENRRKVNHTLVRAESEIQSKFSKFTVLFGAKFSTKDRHIHTLSADEVHKNGCSRSRTYLRGVNQICCETVRYFGKTEKGSVATGCTLSLR
jgi:hypothetical protein